MSESYFKIYAKKKRSNRQLAALRLAITSREHKIKKLDEQLAALPQEALALVVADGKRQRLISCSNASAEDTWVKVPAYIKLSLLPACAADNCPWHQGEYAWMAHSMFLKRGGPYLCNRCVCSVAKCEAAVPLEHKKKWVARKMQKPYAVGLVMDAETGCVSVPVKP